MTPPRFPDFYIIGAPKCGTTALYEYLSTHPFVCVSRVKEPHFFATDFPSYRKITDIRAYMDLFSGAPENAITGEASVWYLYSESAVREIMRVRPDAKFIVMLRNPVEVVQSLHAQQLTSFVEDILDFEQAWRAQERRARGMNIPFHCSEPKHLQYGKICKFSEQVERLFQVVPKSQVLVLVYERFFSSPIMQYRDILKFLGLPFDERTRFELINANQSPGNLSMHRFVSRPPAIVRPVMILLRALSRKFGLRLGVFSRYLAGMRVRERSKIAESLEQELHNYFATDLARLETLIGQPLELWRPKARSKPFEMSAN